MIPYSPVYLDGDVPVYESTQLQMYGLPDYWGVWKYRVVRSEY